jgi:hypothetical protein
MSDYPLTEQQLSNFRGHILGKRGEVRVDCPSCEGSQSRTLGINADSGFFQCFRCDVKGNLNNSHEKQPIPEFIWNKSRPVFEHPYLEKKQVPSYGLREDQHENLVVPLYQYGQISTLQFIGPQGKKVLLKKEKGGVKKGSSFIIPGDLASEKKIYVCEGYATAATIRKATGCETVMAVDAGNIEPVVENIRRKYSDYEWIFCADNDTNNKGLDAALKAAAIVQGKVTMPQKAGHDFNDLFIEQGIDAVVEQLQKFVEPGIKNKFLDKFISGEDLDKKFKLSLSLGHTIEKIIPESSNLIVVFGGPGGGKTFMALDKSLCISHGVAWHGKKVKRKPVAYIAAEGQAALLKRIYAWKKHHGIETIQDFSLLPLPCFLDVKSDVSELLAAFEKMPSMPGVVVFDTLARSMVGNENETADMNKIVHAATMITEATGAQIIIVHHTGKNEARGTRGSIALEGGCDTLIKVSRMDNKQLALMCHKQKDDEPFLDMVFNLEISETGHLDADMNPVNSLVPVYDPDATTEKRKKSSGSSLKGQNFIAMNALKEALTEYGSLPDDDIKKHMPADLLMQSIHVVHEDHWRDYAYKMRISDKGQEAMQKAFSRARNSLIELGRVQTWNAFYWTL